MMIRRRILGAVSANLAAVDRSFTFEKRLAEDTGARGNRLLNTADPLEKVLARAEALEGEEKLTVCSGELLERMRFRRIPFFAVLDRSKKPVGIVRPEDLAALLFEN